MAAQHDLRIDQGTTFTRTFVYWQDETKTAAVDLTGYTARMQFRKHAQSAVADFDTDSHAGSLLITDGPAGVVTLSLTDEITAALPAPYKGVFDIEITSAGGVVTRLVQGSVTIDANVTRD